ncbi:MAG TPA: diaminopimelate epimerase [Lachnospiraceae bacterium]|nr:diaminopimelate epimerase [Lachnospiraceae bacterium]
MRFTKMHGCGNDYIYVYTGTEKVADEIKPELAVRLSDRHKGIGSDGLIFINPAEGADFEMEMYNSDGSRGAMCGNGIRCVGKYVYDHGLTDKTSIDILTGAGVKRLELMTENGKATGATVNMGIPILEPKKIPVVIEEHDSSKPVIDHPIIAGGMEYRITCVSMGNPHCVIFCDEDVSNLDIAEIGPLFEHHVIFPDRVNTEFVNVHDRGHLKMRVWERGSGETMACGTGATAVLVAASLNDLSDRRAEVSLLGGTLTIDWKEDGNVYMTGPAETVFESEISI